MPVQVRQVFTSRCAADESSSRSSIDEASRAPAAGLSINKKLPIKKRTSMSVGTGSLESDIYYSSRLDVRSTVSSSDLESSHSNVAESFLQPVQRQLQPINTLSGVYAPARSTQVRVDERPCQAWPDSSGSLRGQHALQETGNAAQADVCQPNEDGESPRKLAIRRDPQRARCPSPQRHFQSVVQSPRQRETTSTIMEEPWESHAGLCRQQAPGCVPSAGNTASANTGYRHSIASPHSGADPASPQKLSIRRSKLVSGYTGAPLPACCARYVLVLT